MEITEELINSLAINTAAVNNGKKISQKNGFVKLNKSKDDTLLFGECSGSGKSNYFSSVDFIDEAAPVFRCSCPSRQFPCKHCIALMFDYLNHKEFTIEEVPEDIAQKRDKIKNRQEKQSTEKTPKKTNKAALKKKIEKQLEGLDVLDKFIKDCTDKGIANSTQNPIKIYENISKQMGDYYLNGPQILMREIVIAITNLNKNSISNEEAFNIISKAILKLNAISKKARKYLSTKLESDDIDMDASSICEDIGYLWQVEKLKELNLVKTDAKLMQLSFFSEYSEARKEYIDTGIWIDLDNGEISKTLNYRPLKALKYIKADDTVFDVVNTKELVYYPGEINKRIKFENTNYTKVTKVDISKIKEFAKEDLSNQVKIVKNTIKNVLSQDSVFMLVPFDTIGKSDDKVLLCQNGKKINLKNRNEKTTELLINLKDKNLLNNNVLLGEYFYDINLKKICIMPYAIITDEHIVRLLF